MTNSQKCKDVYANANDYDYGNDYHYAYQIFKCNLTYYRRQKGYTQKKLAEELHISRTYLSNIESLNSSAFLSIDLLLRISELLEIPPSKLLELRT